MMSIADMIFFVYKVKYSAAKAALLLPRGRRQYYNQPISVLICLSAFFSSRETCACEMPTSAEISV